MFHLITHLNITHLSLKVFHLITQGCQLTLQFWVITCQSNISIQSFVKKGPCILQFSLQLLTFRGRIQKKMLSNSCCPWLESPIVCLVGALVRLFLDVSAMVWKSTQTNKISGLEIFGEEAPKCHSQNKSDKIGRWKIQSLLLKFLGMMMPRWILGKSPMFMVSYFMFVLVCFLFILAFLVFLRRGSIPRQIFWDVETTFRFPWEARCF